MKIKLDISINAPQILIPLNSMKQEGFIVNFGHIGISNSFQIIPETSSMETKAILDIITVDLSGLTLFRCSSCNVIMSVTVLFCLYLVIDL